MWRAVDRNLSGWVSLREFDQRAFELLGGLRCWSLSIFGSVENMFNAIDSNGGGDVTWKEFSAKLVEFADKFDIALDSDDVLYMFNGLDLDGQKRLTIDELEFLEKWDLALDLEEEHVFPSFRLWSTGDETKEMVKQALHIDEQRRAREEARETEKWKREGLVVHENPNEEEKDDFRHSLPGLDTRSSALEARSSAVEARSSALEARSSVLEGRSTDTKRSALDLPPGSAVSFDDSAKNRSSLDASAYNPRLSKLDYQRKAGATEGFDMTKSRDTLYEIHAIGSVGAQLLRFDHEDD
jgi:hypothetical protein